MELEDLQRAARAAREFTHVIGHATFTLRVPTPHEAEIAAVRSATDCADGSTMVRTQRALLEQGIVGWAGPRVRDVLPEHEQGDEPIKFAPAAVPLLLDGQPGWARELWQQLLQRIEARNAARSTAAKNSSAASPGSDPEPMRTSS